MKVSELISKLQSLDPDATIRVVVPIEGRPYGGFLKEVGEITETFDQDTNKMFYTIELVDYEASR